MEIQMVVLYVLCGIMAVLRFVLPAPGLDTADIYKDIAHLFVGGILGAALATREKEEAREY